MKTSEAIGVILESDSPGTSIAALQSQIEPRLGSIVWVAAPTGPKALAVVRRIWSGGGIFTRDTASFHLTHLNEAFDRARSTFLFAELVFIASVQFGESIDRRFRPLRAGELIFPVEAADVRQLLDLRDGDIYLGQHASHPDVRISIDINELSSSHMAILGQTGSGKTNVLKLIHAGLAHMDSAPLSYVIFDFHEEFEVLGREIEIGPPFAFGPNDLNIETLLDLLPGLSQPQQDMLAGAMETGPESLDKAITLVGRADGSEATKRVLTRRLGRLQKARAFHRELDIGQRVVAAAAHPGSGIIVRMGAVQNELAQSFVASIIRRLMLHRMTETLPRVLFLVDEAHRFASNQAPATVLRSLRFVAQEGRKFGVTLIVATQRPSLLDQTVLSQCGSLVALRLTSAEDARVITQINGELRPTDLGSLGLGQGIISRALSPDVIWVDFDRYQATASRTSTDASVDDVTALRQLQFFEP